MKLEIAMKHLFFPFFMEKIIIFYFRWLINNSIPFLDICLMEDIMTNTDKKYFRRILLVSKTLTGFPSLGVNNCFLFKVKLLVLSNSVLPEREIRDMFY
jgi:hypothetical protein